MAVNFHRCIAKESHDSAVGSAPWEVARKSCALQVIESIEGNLRRNEADEADTPWLVRLFTSRETIDSRKMQYKKVRTHLSTARQWLRGGNVDASIKEIKAALRTSVTANEKFLEKRIKVIDRGLDIASGTFMLGGSLVVIGSAGAASVWVGGMAVTVYGTSTLGGMLTTMGFSTLAGATGGYAAGMGLAGIRSLANGSPYDYPMQERINYTLSGASMGLFQGSFPFAVRTGMWWAEPIQPGAGIRGTVQAIGKGAVELSPLAITQGTISATQASLSGGDVSQVIEAGALGAVVPFAYSGMAVAMRLPRNLKVLTWQDPNFPGETARVIFYDGMARPYQVYGYRLSTRRPAENRFKDIGLTVDTVGTSQDGAMTVKNTSNSQIAMDNNGTNPRSIYQQVTDMRLQELMDSQLKLQVDVSFDRHHTFLQKHGLSSCKFVLDVGTGNGYFCCRLAKKNQQVQFTGIDFKRDMILRARQTSREFGLHNTKWIEGDITKGVFDHRNILFDGILLRYADVHIPSIATTLRDMRGILNREGKIWIISIELDHMYSRPQNRAFDLYKRGTEKFYEKYGIDGHLASKLPSILREVGFHSVVSELDPMSNIDLGIAAYQRYLMHEATLINAYAPDALSSADLEEIGRFVENDTTRLDYYGTYGVVMISAEVLK